MNNFDKNIKDKLQNHLNKNIEFSSNEKEKVNNYMNKKWKFSTKKSLLTLCTSLVVVLGCILIISSPAYIGNDVTRIIHSFSESKKEPVGKEELSSLFKQNENDQTNVDENNDELEMPKETDSKNEGENQAKAEEENEESNKEIDEENNEEKNETTKTPNKEVFIDILKQYENMSDLIGKQIINYENGGYEFKTFTKKEDVYNLLSEFMTYKAAEEYWSLRLEEQGNKLFLIPMDGDVYFDLDVPYVINKVSENQYEFVQEIGSDLHGETEVTITFRLNDQQWLIDEIKTQVL
ncbi:hypothetical protein [Paraliobacillus zengyii]|uniref:hypothetical protein n=1 Tax=Paraliobacillus zengyii TaxID=2213194 RepID=UPI000E3C04EE|nr:hypothetical protein [Paraliobacillus zengyii]